MRNAGCGMGRGMRDDVAVISSLEPTPELLSLIFAENGRPKGLDYG